MTVTLKNLANGTALAMLLLCAHALGQPPAPEPSPTLDLADVGEVWLPNSGAAAAQQAFHHGLAQLHNFEYASAAADFREAQRLDPDFALAFWGEAMTHNHPIWMQQDRAAALAILARYAPTSEARQARAPVGIERDLLAALDVLYGPGPKNARDDAYSAFMAGLAAKHPASVEVAAFHALSILGTAHEGRDFATYMRAAAVTQAWIHDYPRHPGIAHYQIHSTDDPVHAPLGLAAAQAYADIAPNAAHAQHMTTHIFLALGDWDGTIRANARATDLMNAERAERGLDPAGCGHYPSWLMYGYLQRGDVAPAREIMLRCAANAASGEVFRGSGYYAWQRALYLHDTREWDGEVAALSIEPRDDAHAFEDAVVDGWVALGRNDLPSARAALDRARNLNASRQAAWDAEGLAPAQAERRLPLVELAQLEGRIDIAMGDAPAGLARLQEAVDLEMGLPFGFGPPRPPKPSLELLGEMLLAVGRPADAADALRANLARTPGKRASLRALVEAEAR